MRIKNYQFVYQSRRRERETISYIYASSFFTAVLRFIFSCGFKRIISVRWVNFGLDRQLHYD